MLETACQVHDIQPVVNMLPCDGAWKLTFPNGWEVTLSADHPDYELLVGKAQRSMHRRKPVGVAVDANGRLIDLNHTYQVSVSWVRDDAEDSNRVMVAFWGFSAICYLTRDHPEFERIRATLTDALASGGQVVFANYSWPIEGETEIWNKLLDVRPVSGPAQ
jgi:hypothetical protein